MIKRSIEINPNYYKALFNMGVIYKKTNKYKKAIEYYNKSIEKNSNYPYSYLNKSAIYIEQKKFDQSIKVLTEGIKHNPYAEYLYYNRACCYSILGKFDKAIKDLRKAILICPKIIEMIKFDNDLDNLRKDERFVSLINQNKNNKET